MSGKVPASGAAEREAAHHPARVVDAVVALHDLECYEEIGFAGEAGAVTITTVGMKNDGVRRSELTRVGGPLLDEVELS